MGQEGVNRKLRLRFGLRSLFAATAIVAVAVWSALQIYDWYYSVPLADAVASFNNRAADDPVGKLEPKLTEDEIVASIQSQLPVLDANHRTKAIYRQIVRNKRLPRSATLDSMPGYSPTVGKQYTVWWINLSVVTDENAGFGLRIRETNNPAAAANAATTATPGPSLVPADGT
jgi:hypothetical protein